jgi:hypothetical protein
MQILSRNRLIRVLCWPASALVKARRRRVIPRWVREISPPASVDHDAERKVS